MPGTPKELGTLIAVVLKARHLPNKRHIGKQAPYCTLTFNNDKRRTKTIHRGGQNPEWDEEIRFTLFEDLEPSGDGDSPPPPPPKNPDAKITLPQRVKGGSTMTVACFAGDQREPELIGEGVVDLTEVLTTGETDEWFTLMDKEKYCGEVYLELTFWSSEKPPAPKKKNSQPPTAVNQDYGGPGSFTPLPPPSALRPGPGPRNPPPPEALSGAGRRTSGIQPPPSLTPSSSLARLNLYVPPYDRRDPFRQPDNYNVDNLTNNMAELGVMHSRRQSASRPSEIPSYYSDPSGLPYSNSHERFGSNESNYAQSTISSHASFHSYDSLSNIHGNHAPFEHQYHPSTSDHGYGSGSIYGGHNEHMAWEDQRTAGSYIHADSHSAPLPGDHYGHRIPSPPPFLGQVNSGHNPPQGSLFYSSSLPEDHASMVVHQTPPRNPSSMGYGQPPPAPLNGYYSQPPLPPPVVSSTAPFPTPAPNQGSPYRYTTPTPHQQTPPHGQGSRPLPDPYNASHRPLSRVSSLTQNRPSTVEPSANGRVYGRPSLPNNIPPPPPLTPPRASPPSHFAPTSQPPPPPPPSHSFASIPPPPPLPTTSFDFSAIPPPPPPPWEGAPPPAAMPQPLPSSSFAMYPHHQ